MSERTTAEIVADLRLHSNLHPLLLVAADRLEALDAENDAFHDLAEFDALRPPCPTCGGTRIDSKLTPVQMVGFCPDCSDGRVPWERLVNFWIKHHGK